MKCRLCHNERSLRNSHIIPEFLFRALYSEEKHQFIQIEGLPKVRKWQKGFTEEMLCEECEGKLNKWETYAAHVLFGGTAISYKKISNFNIISDVEYHKFKLFQLSLIWRAGVSTRQQFSNVNLGPHEEKLRLMLEKENSGKLTDYGCLLILTPSYFNLTSKMMMLAQESRFDGHRCYILLLAGISWVFFISSHTDQLPFKDNLFLNSNGVLPILIEDVISKRFFEKTFYRWKKSGNLNQAL